MLCFHGILISRMMGTLTLDASVTILSRHIIAYRNACSQSTNEVIAMLKVQSVIINAYPKDDERGNAEVEKLLSITNNLGNPRTTRTRVVNLYEYENQTYEYETVDGRNKKGLFKLGRSVIYNTLFEYIYDSQWYRIDYGPISFSNPYKYYPDSYHPDYVFIFLIGKGKRAFVDKDGIQYEFVSNVNFSESDPPENMFARCKPIGVRQIIHPMARKIESPLIAEEITIEGDIPTVTYPMYIHKPFINKLVEPIEYSIPLFDYVDDEVKKVGEKTIVVTHRLYAPDENGEFKNYDFYYHSHDELSEKHTFHYIRKTSYPMEAAHIIPITKDIIGNSQITYIDRTEDIIPKDSKRFKNEDWEYWDHVTESKPMTHGLPRTEVPFSSYDLMAALCSTIRLEEIRKYHSGYKLPDVFVFVDCNYSGNFVDNINRYLERSLFSDQSYERRQYALDRFTVWASCAPSELSWSDAREGTEGVFVHHFTNCLDKWPYSKYKDLKKFISMLTETVHIKAGSDETRPQHPQFVTHGKCFDNLSSSYRSRFPYHGK